MDRNQNTAFSNFNSTCWNLEKMGSAETDNVVHEQIIPMDSVWGVNYPFQIQQIPSSSSSSSSSSSLLPTSCSGFLSDMLGIHSSKHEEEEEEEEEPEEELGAMKEMMYKIAAMQPVDIDPETIRRPKRRNVRISDDPQSVAARHRRERISEKIRILQRLVPGGTKMDTASMLDEAIRYVKFLKRQIRLLQSSPHPRHPHPQCIPALGFITNTTATTTTNAAYSGLATAAAAAHDWPFAPNMLQYYAPTTNTTTSSSPMSMDTATAAAAAALGFNAGGGGGPTHHDTHASSFNHEVISD